MDIEAIKTKSKDQLRKDEGFSAVPYTDTTGNLTIGYGRNLSKTKLRITEAELMLENDVVCATLELFKVLPWTRTQPDDIICVLVNMTFNMGMGGLLEFRRFLAALQEGARETAAREMINSLWAVQVGDRSTRLANIVRGVSG